MWLEMYKGCSDVSYSLFASMSCVRTKMRQIHGQKQGYLMIKMHRKQQKKSLMAFSMAQYILFMNRRKEMFIYFSLKNKNIITDLI